MPKRGIVNVPCNKCNFCLQNKRAEWTFRLFQEYKHSTNAKFLTLTYDDIHLTYGLDRREALCKQHVQLFIKRVRKAQATSNGPKIRYYGVGEYGSKTSRPHYHLLVFNVLDSVAQRLTQIWNMGHVHIGDVNQATIHYTTKYMIDKGDGPIKPFTLMSTKPAIGHQYLTPVMKAWHREDMRGYAVHDGFKIRLARYYKERIFTKAERENRLFYKSLQMSDKQFIKELERLEKFHPDPFNYLMEKTTNALKQVKTKIKSVI